MENLVKIQNELKVPKGNFNSFGKYKYRSAEDILEAVKPILLKYEASLLLTDRIVEIGGKIFLQATASLYFKSTKIDGLPMFYESQGYAETSEHKGMSAEQTTGTASSYARKYALNGLLLIDETESDADNQNTQSRVKTETKPQLTALQFEAMINTINDGNAETVKKALDKYIISEQYMKAINLAIEKIRNNGKFSKHINIRIRLSINDCGWCFFGRKIISTEVIPDDEYLKNDSIYQDIKRKDRENKKLLKEYRFNKLTQNK